jgi:hypothetical protein
MAKKGQAMADDGAVSGKALKGLEAVTAAPKQRGLPPVHLWNPEFCGDIDMEIRADGSWWYMGSPIGRQAMVRLFASILRKEPDGSIVLVTPVEKVGIRVEDAPFVAVLMRIEDPGPGQRLVFRTNVGDETVAGPENPIRVEIDPETGEPRPYVHVRAGLEALIARAVFYDLVELAEAREAGGRTVLRVRSGGAVFELGET